MPQPTELDNDPPIINPKPNPVDPFGLLTDDERDIALTIVDNLPTFVNTIEMIELDPNLFHPCSRSWRRTRDNHGFARWRISVSSGSIAQGTLHCDDCYNSTRNSDRARYYNFVEVREGEPAEGFVRCYDRWAGDTMPSSFEFTAPDGTYLITESSFHTMYQWRVRTNGGTRRLSHRVHGESNWIDAGVINPGVVAHSMNNWLYTIQDNWQRAGRDYALLNNVCFACDRPLNDTPRAQRTGLNPVCHRRLMNAVV